jgi:hypothetical protein
MQFLFKLSSFIVCLACSLLAVRISERACEQGQAVARMRKSAGGRLLRRLVMNSVLLRARSLKVARGRERDCDYTVLGPATRVT